MEVDKILDAVEKLHQNAKKQDKIIINKIIYYFNFTGHNYHVTSSDSKIDVNFNTREIRVAKKWLKDYLNN